MKLKLAMAKKIYLAAITILLMTNLSPAQAYVDNYTPIAPKDKTKRFKLKTVVSEGLKKDQVLPIGLGEMHLADSKEGEPQLIIEGKDKTGKGWRFQKPYAGLGTTFFLADLDKNGMEDIILMQATGGCGLAPMYCMTILTFDKMQKPFVFEFFGYYNWDEVANDEKPKKLFAYCDDILDLNGDGKAEIVLTQLSSNENKGKYHSFWTTTMYSCIDSRWKQLPAYNGNKLPLQVRYTIKPNLKVLPSAPANITPCHDLSSLPESKWRTAVLNLYKRGGDNQLMQMVLDGKKRTVATGNGGVYLFDERGKTFEIISLDSPKFDDVLEEVARDKALIRYLPSSVPAEMPPYMWAK
ncbi:MAG: hypothetical protein SFY67_14300 [Candidatus Melainabacteria bacterium]|nr:hypothetical protein [Candidatus Melainabacteria bacterium]